MSPIMCIVLALVCVIVGLIEYFRPRPNPPGGCCSPIFWPLLGILILEICKMFPGGKP